MERVKMNQRREMARKKRNWMSQNRKEELELRRG
jgi:hypothetical protein